MAYMNCDMCGNSFNTDFDYLTEFKGDYCCEDCLEARVDSDFKLGSEEEVINYIFKLLTEKRVTVVKRGNELLIAKKLPNGTVLRYVLTLYCEFYDCATNIILRCEHKVNGFNKGFVVPKGKGFSIVKNEHYTNALEGFKKACIGISRSKQYHYENNFNIGIAEDNSGLVYTHVLDIDILNGDTKVIDYPILNTVINKLEI